MVAAGDCQPDSSLTDPSESSKCPKYTTRDYGSVRKPELKKVAVDEKVVAAIWDGLEEPMKGPRGITGIRTQMSI